MDVSGWSIWTECLQIVRCQYAEPDEQTPKSLYLFTRIAHTANTKYNDTNTHTVDRDFSWLFFGFFPIKFDKIVANFRRKSTVLYDVAMCIVSMTKYVKIHRTKKNHQSTNVLARE